MRDKVTNYHTLKFDFKLKKNKCFDYVFTSIKYMIVLWKHQVQRLNKIAWLPTLSSILINSHQFLSTLISSYQLSSTLINSHQRLSTLIHTYQLASTLINSYQLSSTLIHTYQLSSTLIHTYQLLSTLINSHQLSSTLINSHQFSSSFDPALILLQMMEKEARKKKDKEEVER